ncbi:acetyltransferase [Flavobacterium supellecticarium]|uniref:Acetyltransferase n=1 Tax=Flavobacterium supellecticarium TaxID=2565924 RepID=A0A4S3ZXK0_9FLAO|nr:acetyltransferase [Flavobacterium supellecticarium]THF50561.1 acetyltransferase [Flavobacterium supellecticarium]
MYLYGGSGHCKVIIDIVDSTKEYKIDGILDDNPKAEHICGIPVLESTELTKLKNETFIVSIGDNAIRKKIATLIAADFVSAIHSKAVVSPHAVIGNGTVVMPNAIVNSGAAIGKHCIVNSGAVVEHDCVLEDFVHISPNAALAGGVVVGEGAHIGIGATVIPGITIGKWAVVGAGAVIIRDVPDGAIVVGNPGKEL